MRELLIPEKARKELRRSQNALQSGDARSSAQHLERALQIYPNYLEGHNRLGSCYIELREYEKAAGEFQKAIDIDPRVMAPINNLSVALFLLQRYPEAEAHYVGMSAIAGNEFEIGDNDVRKITHRLCHVPPTSSTAHGRCYRSVGPWT